MGTELTEASLGSNQRNSARARQIDRRLRQSPFVDHQQLETETLTR